MLGQLRAPCDDLADARADVHQLRNELACSLSAIELVRSVPQSEGVALARTAADSIVAAGKIAAHLDQTLRRPE